MRKKGENSFKCAGKSATPPDKIMISPSVSKVKHSILLPSLPSAPKQHQTATRSDDSSTPKCDESPQPST